jgi:hypothetical protein
MATNDGGVEGKPEADKHDTNSKGQGDQRKRSDRSRSPPSSSRSLSKPPWATTHDAIECGGM